MVFGALKRRVQKAESSTSATPEGSPAKATDDAPTAVAGNDADGVRLHVTHHLTHSFNEVTHVAWHPTAKVLAAATSEYLYVIGHGWSVKRFKLYEEAEESRVVCLAAMRKKHSFVLARSRSVTIVDFDSGSVSFKPSAPGYTFTSATTLVADDWIMVGRSDGVVQGLDSACSQTKLSFNVHDVPGAVVSDGGESITTVISRMFHKQIVIVDSDKTGLCQINVARNEVLSRFGLPKGGEVSCVSMCAIDKYLLAGLADGRISVWKANDEGKHKKNSELPPMLVVPAMTAAGVQCIECYAVIGNEDRVPCRWVTKDTIVEAVLRPKDQLPAAVSMAAISQKGGFDGGMCGLTTSPWPERCELPSQLVVLAGGHMQLVDDQRPEGAHHPSWVMSDLHPFGMPGQAVARLQITPALAPNTLAHSSKRHSFPHNAGGRSAFSAATIELFDSCLVLAGDSQGSLAAMKAILSRDAVAPHTLRVTDDVNKARADGIPGNFTPVLQGNAVIACAGGSVFWIDMATLRCTKVQLPEDMQATCATFVGMPLNRIIIGTSDGRIATGKSDGSWLKTSSKGDPRPVLSVAVACLSEGKWVIASLSRSAEADRTQLSLVVLNPDAADGNDGGDELTFQSTAHTDPNAESQPESPVSPSQGSQHSPASPEQPPNDSAPVLPLQPVGRYNIQGPGPSLPDLICLTPADMSPTASSTADPKTLPFNAGAGLLGVPLLPASAACTFVIRLADDAFDRGTPTLTVHLFEPAGNEAITLRMTRLDDHKGFISLHVTWHGGPFSEPKEVATAEVEELAIVAGEDSVLALRLSQAGSVALTLCSVDSAKVPNQPQIVDAVRRAVSAGEKASGGPMWAVKHITELPPPVILSEEDAGRRYTVLSASTEPESCLKGFSVYDDLADPDAPEAPVLVCVNDGEDEADRIGTISLDYSLRALLVRSGAGCVQQVQLEEQSGASSVKVGLSPPLNTQHGLVLASSVAVVTLPNVGPCALAVAQNKIIAVRLPLPVGVAPVLLEYESDHLSDLIIAAVVDLKVLGQPGICNVHVLGCGGDHNLLHLILSTEEEVAGVLHDIDEDDREACVVQKPFAASVLGKLPPRPQFKAPGMGAITMKSMFRNHPKEVQHVDSQIAQVVEETFDEFTERVLPAQQREELLGIREADRKAEGTTSQTKAMNSAVGDVKDVMERNKQMLMERGEKVQELDDNVKEMAKESETFYEAVRQLNERQKKKKWWQL
ncbi:hypothetical protein DIPPA_11998 [Diplonema papillatum]|nr:hypothetical protein DIPPA_11998 [Diplonema papillatum]